MAPGHRSWVVFRQQGRWANVKSTNLDFLRAAAVLCVVVCHAVSWAGIYDLPALGRFGVVLFFVHTACVLMQSMERLEGSALSGWQLLFSFGIRRAFRIYPLCMTVILLIAFAHLPVDPTAPYASISAAELFSNVALANHFTGERYLLNVLWSLPVELEMYCLLPFFYLAVKRWGLRSLAVAYALFVWASFHVTWYPGRASIVVFGPCFLSGILAYRLAPRLGKLPGWVFPAVGACLIAVFCRPGDAIPVDARMVRAWVCCGVLGFAIAGTKQLRRSWLTEGCQGIAKYSYGIYLTHPLALPLAALVAVPLWARPVATTVIGMGLPVLLYHAIEHPMIRVGALMAESLTKIRSQHRVASAAA
jgi:peptidoglycan/LPS O-acetylase OafA/YrhL